MNKPYKDFFLISNKEPNTDEKEIYKPVSEDYFEVQPLPVLYHSKRCIKERKDKKIQIMTTYEVKRAG